MVCVFRLSHFEYVKADDLEKIGMGRPACRRLLDAVKKRKASRKKSLLDKVSSDPPAEILSPLLLFLSRFCLPKMKKCPQN
jgi:hypothetical protein